LIRFCQSKQLDAGGFPPEISSFLRTWAAEGKAASTVRTYTEAVQWFAAAQLRREVGVPDGGSGQAGRAAVDAWLLDRLSSRAAG
jgi:hypothetical protein